jgi:phospholipid/cholesterol/gamma-HCH transport system substrate-binding protein
VARQQTIRVMASIAFGLVVAVVVVVLIAPGSSYVVHAEFSDAGQLVHGDLVTVAGHQVGSVGSITLTGNGLADVALDISDSSVQPLRSDSVATIGQLSLTGVANRFVSLDPGPGTAIPNGGTLPVTQTHGIVDLDIVLDALTPKVRDSLQTILKTGAYFVSKPTVQSLNGLAQYLDPAFSQAANLSAELVSDRFALQRLVSSSGQLAGKVAANSQSLGGAVSNTAEVLREVASQRSALEDSLQRTPAVLTQGRHVLSDVQASFGKIDPMLTALKPVAPKAATLLRKVVPFAKAFIPTLVDIRRLIPDAKQALNRFVPVERKGVPALNSLTTALTDINPILTALRPYAPDVTAGFFNGVGGSQAAGYDANGHYLRIGVVLQGGASSLAGLLNTLGAGTVKLPILDGVRTGLTAPCPGGGSPPAPDGSTPWTDPPVAAGVGALCNPADDQLP